MDDNLRPTVLLVDDEPMVLESISEVLSCKGYELLKADCGLRALDMLQENCDLVDYVVVDYCLPDMSGCEACDHLWRCKENLPTVITSGLTKDQLPSDLFDRKCASFLQKPFRSWQLLDALRELQAGHA